MPPYELIIMVNYFVQITDETRDILVENGFSYCDFYIDDRPGVTFEDRLLPKFFEITGKRQIEERTTSTYGINEIVVEDTYASRSVSFSKSMISAIEGISHSSRLLHNITEAHKPFEDIADKVGADVAIDARNCLSTTDSYGVPYLVDTNGVNLVMFENLMSTIFHENDNPFNKSTTQPLILITSFKNIFSEDAIRARSITGINRLSRMDSVDNQALNRLPNSAEIIQFITRSGNSEIQNRVTGHDGFTFKLGRLNMGYGFKFEYKGRFVTLINSRFPMFNNFLIENRNFKYSFSTAFIKGYTALVANNYSEVPNEPEVISIDWSGERADKFIDITKSYIERIITNDVLIVKDIYRLRDIDQNALKIINRANCTMDSADRDESFISSFKTDQTIFGQKYEAGSLNKLQFYRYSGVGIPIFDEDSGVVIAEYSDRNLYVLFNFAHSSNDCIDLFHKCIQGLLYILTSTDEKKIFMAEKARNLITLSPEDVGTAAILAHRRKTVNIDSDIKRREEESKEAKKKLSNALAELQSLKAMKDGLQNLSEQLANKLISEIQLINNNSKVRFSYLTKTHLIVFTNMIYAEDDRTSIVHEIGQFCISIDLETEYNNDRMFGIRFNNLTRKIHGYQDKMNAPHVYADGTACLGSVESSIPKLAAEAEFAMLAELCLEYLSSANTRDAAGKHIDKWPKKEDQTDLVLKDVNKEYLPLETFTQQAQEEHRVAEIRI